MKKLIVLLMFLVFGTLAIAEAQGPYGSRPCPTCHQQPRRMRYVGILDMRSFGSPSHGAVRQYTWLPCGHTRVYNTWQPYTSYSPWTGRGYGGNAWRGYGGGGGWTRSFQERWGRR